MLSKTIAKAMILLWILLSFQGCFFYKKYVTGMETTIVYNPIFSLTDRFTITRSKSFTIPVESSFFLAMPVISRNDATKNKTNHFVKQLFELEQELFLAAFPKVHANNFPVNVSQSISMAQKKNMDFLIYLMVNDWHDGGEVFDSNCHIKSTNNHLRINKILTPKETSPISNVPVCNWEVNNPIDHIDIRMLLYHVADNKLIDVIYIYSKSGFITFQNDSPKNLLRKPLGKIINTYLAR